MGAGVSVPPSHLLLSPWGPQAQPRAHPDPSIYAAPRGLVEESGAQGAPPGAGAAPGLLRVGRSREQTGRGKCRGTRGDFPGSPQTGARLPVLLPFGFRAGRARLRSRSRPRCLSLCLQTRAGKSQQLQSPGKCQQTPAPPLETPPQGPRETLQRRAGCSKVLKYLVPIYLKSSQFVDTIYIIKNTWRLVLLAKIYISV